MSGTFWLFTPVGEDVEGSGGSRETHLRLDAILVRSAAWKAQCYRDAYDAARRLFFFSITWGGTVKLTLIMIFFAEAAQMPTRPANMSAISCVCFSKEDHDQG